MTQRHDDTNSLFLYQFVNVLKWRYRFISVIFQLLCSKLLSFMYLHDMFSCRNVTSWRHWIYTTLRQETYFLHLSLQVCSRADPIFVSVISLVAELNFVIVIVFAWWNNVTKWRHDVIKHAVPISACSSARDIICCCFYSILGCWVQKYHWFYICICGYVITWRHDVTDIIWRHKSHYLYQLVDVLEKWFVASLYGCLSCSIRKCHRICICMISLHAVTSWSWRPVTI